ncbi:uncharacterized protein Dana_GF23917 [Drosophila ananassae]|uniref:BPTI/Kunitz inhibitor domain-containing protein n=1 Tax=Drosophila ananassae TaxID=7217 RepID=B3MU03_DROAN|nr:thrombospondin type-1 domain-containing protein 7A [Drosophila ananassae]EDV33332.2 uncharacterized protein Dana_GF23917 [Drosophila ananassae]
MPGLALSAKRQTASLKVPCFGIGITMRTRTFVGVHLGRKRCPHITVVEKTKCMRPDCTYEQVELPDPMCPTTQWSDWSPCTSTCGKGVTIRTRLLLLENGPEKENCTRRMELHQQKECINPTDCHINAEQAKEVCVQSPDTGPCRGNYMRYAYNPQCQSCDAFNYGGCRGNRNNFLTENDCLHTYNSIRGAKVSGYLKECVLSEWSGWSACSVSCGAGFAESRRQVISEAQNRGRLCSKKLVKHRPSTMPSC